MPYDTKLSPSEESKFQIWKSVYAPKDSGQDYDLRGAFKAGLSPNPTSGHWPDTFKKPNHPTFSDQSIYANYAPEKAGTWQGDTYIPPTKSMAYNDDLLNAAQKRTRTGRSFFPAANYSQGQTLIPSRYGTSSAVLPPDQNPAYQAAIARPRTSGGLIMVNSPDGVGSMGVSPGHLQNWLNKGYTLPPLPAPTGPLTSQQYASNYSKGYGAPAPSFNSGTGTVASGGVETPVEALTPQQRSVLPGSNPFVDQWGANFSAQHPTLAAFGTLAANAFRGLQGKFNSPAGAQYANNVSTGQVPSQPTTAQQQSVQSQNFYNYNPSPAPPRRYSDLGYY